MENLPADRPDKVWILSGQNHVFGCLTIHFSFLCVCVHKEKKAEKTFRNPEYLLDFSEAKTTHGQVSEE